MFAATADPPQDWDASLRVWSATISTHALHNPEVFDGEVAVLSSYVKAHVLADKGVDRESCIVTLDASDGSTQDTRRYASQNSPM